MSPDTDLLAQAPQPVAVSSSSEARLGTRDLFSRCAATVNLITVRDGEVATAMTATSVCSLSLDPPSALVCVNRDARTRHTIAAAGSFVINVLSRGQEEVANTFSRPGSDKTIPVELLNRHPELERYLDEFAVVEGVAGALLCRLEEAVDFGSHSIMIGLVQAVFENVDGPQPLIYHDRRYVSTQVTLDEATLQNNLDARLMTALGW